MKIPSFSPNFFFMHFTQPSNIVCFFCYRCSSSNQYHLRENLKNDISALSISANYQEFLGLRGSNALRYGNEGEQRHREFLAKQFGSFREKNRRLTEILFFYTVYSECTKKSIGSTVQRYVDEICVPEVMPLLLFPFKKTFHILQVKSLLVLRMFFFITKLNQ